MEAKICGVKDSRTLSYIVNHNYSPKFVGFICNYTKSKRYVEFNNLEQLISTNKKKTNFVAVLVKPDEKFLEKIKYLNFDYFQLYDVSPDQTKHIKKKYKKKIITALTVENKTDVEKYKKYIDISDIILFDGKGYEKSMSFDHLLIKNLPNSIKKMLAGNIKYDEKLENYNKIADIIDMSGGLETFGLKDISKINIFLNKIKQIKNET